MSRRLTCVTLAVAALGLPGCFWVTTKSEGNTLRKDLASLQGRVDGQLNETRTVLDDATKLLKRNNANLGADVDQLRADQQALKGTSSTLATQLAEARAAFEQYRQSAEGRIAALEAKLAQLESGKASAATGPDELWRLATTAFEAQRWSEANDLFKRVVTQYPGHDRADDAQYFRGQGFTNQKLWEDAIREYQRLYEKYPTSSLADDGLYFAALAAEALKNCNEARTYLALLKEKFPASNVAKLGADADKRIKAGKGTARCTD